MSGDIFANFLVVLGTGWLEYRRLGVEGASRVEGTWSKSANIGSLLSDAEASWSMVGRLSV